MDIDERYRLRHNPIQYLRAVSGSLSKRSSLGQSTAMSHTVPESVIKAVRTAGPPRVRAGQFSLRKTGVSQETPVSLREERLKAPCRHLPARCPAPLTAADPLKPYWSARLGLAACLPLKDFDIEILVAAVLRSLATIIVFLRSIHEP